MNLRAILVDAPVKSWRTTLIGLVLALAIVWPEIAAMVDGNADTIPDWDKVIQAIMTFVFGSQVRDNNVTSEQAGAIKKTT